MGARMGAMWGSIPNRLRQHLAPNLGACHLNLTLCPNPRHGDPEHRYPQQSQWQATFRGHSSTGPKQTQARRDAEQLHQEQLVREFHPTTHPPRQRSPAAATSHTRRSPALCCPQYKHSVLRTSILHVQLPAHHRIRATPTFPHKVAKMRKIWRNSNNRKRGRRREARVGGYVCSTFGWTSSCRAAFIWCHEIACIPHHRRSACDYATADC